MTIPEIYAALARGEGVKCQYKLDCGWCRFEDEYEVLDQLLTDVRHNEFDPANWRMSKEANDEQD